MQFGDWILVRVEVMNNMLSSLVIRKESLLILQSHGDKIKYDIGNMVSRSKG